MPINKSMMTSLKKQYGNKKGESVYYALEAKRKKQKGSITKKAMKGWK